MRLKSMPSPQPASRMALMPSTPAAFNSFTWRRASSGVLGVRTNCAAWSCADASGTVRSELRAVAAFGSEHGAADGEHRPQAAAGGDLRAEFARSVQAIAYAARRGDAAVEQGGGGVRHGLVGVVILGGVRNAAGARQVYVYVDEAGQQRFAGAFHHFGAQVIGVRRPPRDRSRRFCRRAPARVPFSITVPSPTKTRVLRMRKMPERCRSRNMASFWPRCSLL